MSKVEHRLAFRALFDRVAAGVDRRLQPEHADAFWRAFQHEDLDLLEKALDIILLNKTDRELPTVGEIAAEVRALKHAHVPSTSREAGPYCPTCGSSGAVVVHTLRDGAHGLLALRCPCLNGRRWPAGMTQYEPPPGADHPLPQVSVEDLADYSPGRIFEEGVEVIKPCKVCGEHYTYRHGQRVSVAAMLEIHSIESLYECEKCFVARGRRAGFWQ